MVNCKRELDTARMFLRAVGCDVKRCGRNDGGSIPPEGIGSFAGSWFRRVPDAAIAPEAAITVSSSQQFLGLRPHSEFHSGSPLPHMPR